MTGITGLGSQGRVVRSERLKRYEKEWIHSANLTKLQSEKIWYDIQILKMKRLKRYAGQGSSA